MNQSAVQQASIQAERLLERGDREALRQMIRQLNELLARGPTADQGGPVGVDADILAAALKIQMKKALQSSTVGKLVAAQLCARYRENFVGDVNSMCGGELTLEEQERVADKFNIVLCFWLRAAAESIQKETQNYYDLEVIEGG